MSRVKNYKVLFLSILSVLASALTVLSCGSDSYTHQSSCRYAAYFSVETDDQGNDFLVFFSPYDDSADTLKLTEPMTSIVCMSSSYSAGLAEIGAADAVSGISGLNYVSNPELVAGKDRIKEVGYDSSLDYETVLSLKPDVVLAYSTSSVKAPYIEKLESLGIRVISLYDFLEDDPLARAEYLKVYGVLSGRSEQAEILFNEIESAYLSTIVLDDDIDSRPSVLVNVPYSDAWYIPGKDNYFSKLVYDAGGVITGAQPGRESSVISLETAFGLSADAEIWLNPGWNLSRNEIASIHPLVSSFPVLAEGRIYNNIKRSNDFGGNDFWESGAVRPDLILKDLVKIIHPELSDPDAELEYYLEIK